MSALPLAHTTRITRRLQHQCGAHNSDERTFKIAGGEARTSHNINQPQFRCNTSDNSAVFQCSRSHKPDPTRLIQFPKLPEMFELIQNKYVLILAAISLRHSFHRYSPQSAELLQQEVWLESECVAIDIHSIRTSKPAKNREKKDVKSIAF